MFPTRKVELLKQYIELLANYDCRVCKSRKDTIKCIPRPMYLRKTGLIPLFIVNTFPKLADEQAGYICQTVERERIFRWLDVSESTDTYISAVFKCPVKLDDFGNEISPTIKDIRRCAYLYLKKEIEFINPKVIVAFGERAIAGLVGVSTIEAKKYMFTQYNLGDRIVFGMYHPAFMDRGGIEKEESCIKLLREAYTLNRRLQGE